MYALADGTMTATSLSKISDTSMAGAITGGTGAYANARGTFSSKPTKVGADTVVTLVD